MLMELVLGELGLGKSIDIKVVVIVGHSREVRQELLDV